MERDFEDIQKRLQAADAKSYDLDEALLEKAPTAPKKRIPNPRASRFGLTAVAGIGAIGVLTTGVANSPDQPLITLANDQRASDASMESSIASDSLPAWINPYQYKAGPELSDSTGAGDVYELVIKGNPRDRLQEFAAIFGESGNVELEEWSTDYFPSYRLETDSAYLSLYWHGSGMINYSSKRNWLSEECYLMEDDLSENELSPREECKPLPTVPMPAADTLAAEAFELISSAGYQGQLRDIQVERYEWGASAFASTFVNGEQTAIEWYVGWDQTGQVANVSGHLAEPVLRGSYPTISPRSAVERIAEGYWFGAAPRGFYDYSILETDASALDGSVTSDSEGTVDAEDELTVMPVEPDWDLEVMELTVNSHREAMLLIEDSQGQGWLVPGYLLETDRDWFEAVVSLEEGVIQPPEPIRAQ